MKMSIIFHFASRMLSYPLQFCPRRHASVIHTLPGQYTVGPLKIGDDVITKDSLFVIIVEIDTRIYKTYPKLTIL